MRYSLRSILLPLWRLTPPTEGFHWTISVKICTVVKGWLKYKMAKKYCRKFQPQVGCTNVTDDRQTTREHRTDGFVIANTRM